MSMHLIIVHVVGLIVGLIVGHVLGTTWGIRIAIRGLTLGADDRDRTPHCLGGRFYYVVPESEYVQLSMLRHKAEFPESAPP